MPGTWGLNLFDRFHIGHQVMIDRISEMPDPVACVTGGKLVADGLELEALIQPIELREANLRKYLANAPSSESISDVKEHLRKYSYFEAFFLQKELVQRSQETPAFL
ncbi:MAG: hypothetical protein ACFFBL_03780, partial [Promethearchaeota archaeon]